MVDIQFLYFEDFPSDDEALRRLREVMREEGIETSIEMIKVETEAQTRSTDSTCWLYN